MAKKVIGVIIGLAIVGAIGVFALSDDTSAPAPKTNTNTNTNSSDAEPESEETTATTGTEFTITATDESANPSSISVKKGDKVDVTFNVSQSGVYYGGLEFKSDVVSSGPIKPGASKTVTFTADQSFDFTPYWYESNVKKDYIISVKVN